MRHILAALAATTLLFTATPAQAKPHAVIVVHVKKIPGPPPINDGKRPPGPIICPRPIPGHADCFPAPRS